MHFSVVDHVDLKDIRFSGRLIRSFRLFIRIPYYFIDRRRDRIRHSIFLDHFEYLVPVELFGVLTLRRRIVEIVLHFSMPLLALLRSDGLLLHHHFELLTIRLIVGRFPYGLRLNWSHRLLSGLFPSWFIFEGVEFFVDHCSLKVELP